jgi:hypothetical protein
MKSLLALLATAAAVPLLVLAQSVPAGPGNGPAVANPNPAPAGPTGHGASATAPHDAAAGVPLPGLPAGASLEKNLPLIPENAPGNPEPGGGGGSHRARPGASPKEFATFSTEEDIRSRLSMRIAQTRVLNEPNIQAQWAAAHNTRTDPEKRALLTIYYNHLYDRMIKLDPNDAQRIEARRQSTLARMKYTRLGDLDNSEDAFVAPTPIPSGPNPPAQDSSTIQ